MSTQLCARVASASSAAAGPSRPAQSAQRPAASRGWAGGCLRRTQPRGSQRAARLVVRAEHDGNGHHALEAMDLHRISAERVFSALQEQLEMVEERTVSLAIQRKEIIELIKHSARVLAGDSTADDLHRALARFTADLEKHIECPNDDKVSQVFTAPAPQPTTQAPVHDRATRSADEEPADAGDCFVQHPGALCCTTANVNENAEQGFSVITLKTTVRSSGDRSMPALANAAAEMSASHADKALSIAREVTSTHEELVEILKEGKIIHAEPNNHDSMFGHPSYKVKLQHPRTKQKTSALFKPRIQGDGDGWHRAPMEWVAYELNLMLGMDYVPPVAYRKGGVDVDFQHFDEGAFIHFVPDAKELQSVNVGEWGCSQDLLLSDTRILDVLLHNSDRHHGHFLHAPHWVAPNARLPVLIDHAASFRKDAFVSLDHENAFRTGPVRVVSARTYLKLRFLDARAIAAAFAGVLTPGEMRQLLQRRNSILDYLDRLVESEGYGRVVLDCGGASLTARGGGGGGSGGQNGSKGTNNGSTREAASRSR